MKSLRNAANDGLGVPAKALLGAPGSLAFEGMQRRWTAEAPVGIFACSRKAKWKSRIMEIPARMPKGIPSSYAWLRKTG